MSQSGYGNSPTLGIQIVEKACGKPLTSTKAYAKDVENNRISLSLPVFHAPLDALKQRLIRSSVYPYQEKSWHQEHDSGRRSRRSAAPACVYDGQGGKSASRRRCPGRYL